MTVALVRLGTVAVTAAASVTPAFGQATTQHNIGIARIMASVASATALTITPPAGWSLVRINSTGGSTGVACAVAWSMDLAASASNPVFSCTGATRMAADVCEFSGITLTSANDHSATDTTGSSPQVTETDANELVIYAEGTTWTKSQSTTSFTDNWFGSAGPTGTTVTHQGTTDKAISQHAASARITADPAGATINNAFAYTMSSSGLVAAQAQVIVSFHPAIASANPIDPVVVAQAVARSTVW